MTKLEPKHWAVVAGLLASLGAQLSTLSSFQAALTPAFVGSILIQVASTVGALYISKPGQSAQ